MGVEMHELGGTVHELVVNATHGFSWADRRNLPPVLVPSVPPLGFDVSERRGLALALRVNGATQKTTATMLGVSQQTISNDLKYCRRHPVVETVHGDDAAVVIGETVEFCEEIRALALLEHARLAVDPAANWAFGTAARLECLRVAILAQRLLIEVLQGAGFIVSCRRRPLIRRSRRRHARGRRRR
jgi:predicted DNA-binding protein (UPF0251 family)